MTQEEIEIVKALSNEVRYLPGSFDKRFAKVIAGYSDEHELTERQLDNIYRMLYSFRRQIPIVYEKYKSNDRIKHLNN